MVKLEISHLFKDNYRSMKRMIFKGKRITNKFKFDLYYFIYHCINPNRLFLFTTKYISWQFVAVTLMKTPPHPYIY